MRAFSLLLVLTCIATRADAHEPLPMPPVMGYFAYKACAARTEEIAASPMLSRALSAQTKAGLCDCMEAHARNNPAIAALYDASVPSDMMQRLKAQPDFEQLYARHIDLAYGQCIAQDISRALDTAIRAVPRN